MQTTTHTTRPLEDYTPEASTFHTWDHDTRYDHVDSSCPSATGRPELGDVTGPGWPCPTCWTFGSTIARYAHPNDPELPHGDGTGRGGSTPDRATPKQLAFLRRLMADAGITPDEDKLAVLGKRAASDLIDGLVALPKPDTAPTHRPNRYPGRCATCGHDVPAETGALTQEAGRWVTRHLPDTCPARLELVPDSGYTVAEGQFHRIDGELRRVRRTRSGHLVGQQVLVHTPAVWDGPNLVTPADVEWEYLGKRGLVGMTADTELTHAEAAEFGHATGRCVFCSTALEDERSVNAGYGPTCADNRGLPWGE
jgi:hypothetical protein